jgi:two-component system, OmpR family, sensor histidine kinase CreC
VLRLVVVAGAAIGLILFAAYIISRIAIARTRGLSVRLQVFLALAAIIGTFSFGLGIMVIDRVGARAARVAREASDGEARAVSGMIQAEMSRTGLSLSEIARALEIQRERGTQLDFRILDRGGSTLFAGDEGGGASFDSPISVVVDAPIMRDAQTVGAVSVATRTVVMRRLLADLAPVVLVISLVLGAAAALAATWIGRAIAAPIEKLTAFSERVSRGERTAAAPDVPGREMRQLAASLDSMRRQLDGRPFVETFAADLSHELKNPVAAIRASAEVLQEGALAEPEEATRFVVRIREATERIERLLRDLLSLARIEARGVEDYKPVDMAALLRSAVDGTEQSDRFSIEVVGDCRVRGDRTWLARAISNLLDNATVHSAPGSEVRASLQRLEGVVRFEVSNPGSISAGQSRRIFRRFVTTRADRGGTGLGLSIVMAVAEAHGGTVSLIASGPPSVRFRVDLPPSRSTALEALSGRRA